MPDPAPTKAELLEALERSGRDATAKLRVLPSEMFDQGRYENGWNARQILAHIASIEWSYRRLLDIPNQAPPASSGVTSSTPAQGGIDAYNQRQVEKRADASVSDLINELEKNRHDTIEAVRAANEALLAKPIRSAGGVEGPLSSVFMAVAVRHLEQHIRDIAGD